MAASAPIGGLYIDVKLNAKDAMDGFDRLKSKGDQVIAGLGAATSGISKGVTDEVNKSIKELERLGKAAQQQGKAVSDATAQVRRKPQTPLAKELADLRTQVRGSGINRDFLNDLGGSGNLAGLNAARARLLELQKIAERIKVDAIDEKDIAQAERLAAKTSNLLAVTDRNIRRVSGQQVTQTQQSAQRQAQGFTNTARAAQGATRAVNQTNASVRQTTASTLQLGGTAAQLTSNLGGVFGALRAGNVGQSIFFVFRNLAQAFSSVAAAGPQAALAITAVALAIAPLVISAGSVVVALNKIGQAGIQAGNDLQSLKIALEGSLGSVGADNELKFLTDRAESSIFDVKGLTQIDRTLLAYGALNTELRQGLLDTLITLGTVGGKSVDELQFAARALGQVFAQGNLKGGEVLQLVNSLGVGREVLKELPKYANLTGAALIELQEKNLIPAADVFEALELRAASFGAVATKATQSVNAQLAKFRDDLPASIGLQFLNAGVQEQLTGLLTSVYNFVSSIDVSPIARGFATVFQQIRASAEGLLSGGGGSAIKAFFEVLLPQVLLFASRTIAAFRSFGIAISPVIDFLGRFSNGVRLASGAGVNFADAFNPLIDGIGLFSKAIAVSLTVVLAVKDALAGLFDLLTNTGPKIIKSFGANFGEALQQIIRGNPLEALKTLFSDVDLDPFDEATARLNSLPKTFAEIDAAIARAKNLKLGTGSSFESPTLGRLDLGKVLEGFDQGPTEEEIAKIKESLEKQKKFYEDVAAKLEEARKELEKLTTRWFGFRSELEKGFLGDNDFEASVDSIASTGQRLIELLRGVGQFAVAADLDRSTRRLIDLAKLRDQFAEQLKEAEQKLADAISARDDFAKRIREQSIAFVNAFKLEEDEVERITKIAGDGFSGYLVNKTKELKSFTKTLRERLDTLKEFRNNINSLAARGLDAGLLEQLVAGGPDQSGDVVRQLAQSGDGVIKEVNGIQKELGTIATKFSKENAKRFYQAGVDTAQAQADGLRFGLKAIQAAAGQIVGTVQKQLEGLAKATGELGRQAGAALAVALSKGAQIGSFAVAAAANDAAKKAAIIGALATQIGTAVPRIIDEVNRRRGLIDAATANAPNLRGLLYRGLDFFLQNEIGKLTDEANRISANPSVNVYIGQERINEIVRTEVTNYQRGQAVNSGVRRP